MVWIDAVAGMGWMMGAMAVPYCGAMNCGANAVPNDELHVLHELDAAWNVIGAGAHVVIGTVSVMC